MERVALGIQSPVGDWVSERWVRSKVFLSLGIDFCCGGKLSLERACQLKGLDPSEVVALLTATQAPEAEDQVDWQAAPIPELVDHILTAHHLHLKQHLPTLGELVDKVARVHGPDHPDLVQVARVFHHFASDMLAHMEKEEQVLFPLCLAHARGEKLAWGPPIQAPIAVMEREHDQAGADLAELRRLNQAYAVPEGACGSWRTMLAGLQDLEANTFRHVHLENHVLFPRALALAC